MASFTDEDDALLDALGVDAEAVDNGSRTPREERIIAGFEEIQRFVEGQGRTPRHGEGHDIFERLYAVRLDRLRAIPDCLTVLRPFDYQGLLADAEAVNAVDADVIDDDELLAQLGVDEQAAGITDLRHVRSAAEKREAEEIANREKCEEFPRFEPLFAQVKQDLESGARKAASFNAASAIKQGEFFIVGGQVAYVAEVGEEFITQYDRRDSRLRVIYDNGTESNVLLRSLERALHRDPAGRRITDLSAGPLFADEVEEEDLATGTVYVLRSNSDDPIVAAHRDLLHKIGITGGDVAHRLANARLDPTFLMADVEVVATYKLANLNRTRLENLIHRIFATARLDVAINDRLGGKPIVPREWFLVPLFVIDEAIERIRDGTIVNFTYEPKSGKLVHTKAG